MQVREENSKLQTQLEAAQLDIHELREALFKAEEEQVALNEDLLNTQTAYAQLDTDYAALHEQQITTAAELQAMTQEKERLVSEVSGATLQLNVRIQTDFVIVTDTKQDLQNAHTQLVQQYEKSQNRIYELEQSLQAATDKAVRYQSRENELAVQLKDMELKYQECIKGVAQGQQHMQQVCKARVMRAISVTS